MGPLTASDLRGVWATVLLPVRDDESIDFDRLAVALDRVLASGVHGVYTNGTAGEFHTLTDAEYDRLHTLVAQRCAEASIAAMQQHFDDIRVRAALLRPSEPDAG